MDDFRQQLTQVLDAMLAEGIEPLFLVVELDGVKELKATHGDESLQKFKQAVIDAIIGATRGADAFTYGDDSVVTILDGREYDRLRTFALMQKLRKAIPLLGQSFDCFLRPGFDVLEYDPQVGVAGLINNITTARSKRHDEETQVA
jgi:GGDEF domain-containing protein